MKRVSFKVANALKEAGYPQENCDEYLNKYGAVDFCSGHNTARPTYLEAWLWLWRNKKYRILLSASNQRWDEVHGIVTGTDGEVCWSYHRGAKAYDATDHDANYQDPEEAIEKAIEFLVDNNLIK